MRTLMALSLVGWLVACTTTSSTAPGPQGPPAVRGEEPLAVISPDAVQGCPQGGCTFACSPNQSCNYSCDGGGCTIGCESGSTCNASCNGGGCTEACGAGGTCNFDCNGGGCKAACADGAHCELSCNGGGCK